MKKKVITCTIASLVIIGGIILLSSNWRNTKVESFSLHEYQEHIEQFSSEKIVGAVETEAQAIKTAEEIWVNTYGERVRFKKPYKVFYDTDNDVWLVRGSLPIYMSGGVPYMLLEKKTGKVLAIWHEK